MDLTCILQIRIIIQISISNHNLSLYLVCFLFCKNNFSELHIFPCRSYTDLWPSASLSQREAMWGRGTVILRDTAQKHRTMPSRRLILRRTRNIPLTITQLLFTILFMIRISHLCYTACLYYNVYNDVNYYFYVIFNSNYNAAIE